LAIDFHTKINTYQVRLLRLGQSRETVSENAQQRHQSQRDRALQVAPSFWAGVGYGNGPCSDVCQ